MADNNKTLSNYGKEEDPTHLSPPWSMFNVDPSFSQDHPVVCTVSCLAMFVKYWAMKTTYLKAESVQFQCPYCNTFSSYVLKILGKQNWWCLQKPHTLQHINAMMYYFDTDYYNIIQEQFSHIVQEITPTCQESWSWWDSPSSLPVPMPAPRISSTWSGWITNRYMPHSWQVWCKPGWPKNLQT